MASATGIGARVLRTEDKRFLTGAGRYVDDLPLARTTYAHFLRSPHAHARIKSIDISAAKAMPGVVEIFTGKDVADAKVGGLICGWVVKDKHGEPHKAPPHPVMAHDTVRYVGDTVAMVVANSHDEAKDAAEAIVVDYEVLPANVDLARALDKGAAEVHAAEAPGNLIYDWEIGVKADVDAGKVSLPKHGPRGPGGPEGKGGKGGKGRPVPPEVLAKYDANHDGKLDDTERAKLKADIESGAFVPPHRPHGRPGNPPADDAGAAPAPDSNDAAATVVPKRPRN